MIFGEATLSVTNNLGPIPTSHKPVEVGNIKEAIDSLISDEPFQTGHKGSNSQEDALSCQEQSASSAFSASGGRTASLSIIFNRYWHSKQIC